MVFLLVGCLNWHFSPGKKMCLYVHAEIYLGLIEVIWEIYNIVMIWSYKIEWLSVCCSSIFGDCATNYARSLSISKQVMISYPLLSWYFPLSKLSLRAPKYSLIFILMSTAFGDYSERFILCQQLYICNASQIYFIRNYLN